MSQRSVVRFGRSSLWHLGSVAAATWFIACRSAPNATGPEAVQAGDHAFQLTVLEDLSRPHDVFRTAQGVYASTDRGLYVYPTSGPPRPTRLGQASGLPSDNVLAARLLPDDTLAVLSARGLVALSTRAGVSPPELPAPPLGVLYDIEVYDGLLYACGELGLARLEPGTAGLWHTLSDLPSTPLTCRALQVGPNDTLFVLGESSFAQLDGDVVREHGAPALPEGRPRAVVEAQGGDLFVLLEREGHGELARFHAGTWWSYSWANATGGAPVVGLVAQAGVPLLVTSSAVLALRTESRGGTPLTATSQHLGQPLLYRATPSPMRTPSSRENVGQRSDDVALASADVPSNAPASAPTLYAHALPQVGVAYEAALASGDWVYLAQPGRGLLEVGEARRALNAGDFRGRRSLTLAVDAHQGTWLRADDGTLVRVERGVARVYPHGRTSALLESVDEEGAPLAGDPWVVLQSPGGEVWLASPTPHGWVEQARMPDAQDIVSVRFGARTSHGHVWLLANGGRAEWSRGYGLAHRDPSGAWSYVDVPLEPRGALDAVTQLVPYADMAIAAGPQGLARVTAQGPAERLFRGPVSDVERIGRTLLFLADGNLFELPLDPSVTGSQAHAVVLGEDASDVVRRTNAFGLARTATHLLLAGDGGLALGMLSEPTPSELSDASWDALVGGGNDVQAHDVEAGARGTWVARRDGAVLVLTTTP